MVKKLIPLLIISILFFFSNCSKKVYSHELYISIFNEWYAKDINNFYEMSRYIREEAPMTGYISAENIKNFQKAAKGKYPSEIYEIIEKSSANNSVEFYIKNIINTYKTVLINMSINDKVALGKSIRNDNLIYISDILKEYVTKETKIGSELLNGVNSSLGLSPETNNKVEFLITSHKHFWTAQVTVSLEKSDFGGIKSPTTRINMSKKNECQSYNTCDLKARREELIHNREILNFSDAIQNRDKANYRYQTIYSIDFTNTMELKDSDSVDIRESKAFLEIVYLTATNEVEVNLRFRQIDNTDTYLIDKPTQFLIFKE